jgi:2-amino-4-hydroxy-6-hydroxymethyldihydropteridine diphosphokinase
MAISYIGLGSNLGNRKANINRSLDIIQESCHTDILKVSSLIETESEPNKDLPKFLNGVVKIETSLKPEELLSFLKEVEIRLGRKNKGDNKPRLIDLDILLYDNLDVISKDLVIPHPEMFKRRFVLKPLLNIDPDIIDKNPLVFIRKKDILKILV